VLKQQVAAQAHQIQIWPIDRMVFYARNPRKNDSFEVIAAEREKGAM
jgi:hypothetical protein